MKRTTSTRSYTFTKRGVFYFQRRVPMKVKHLYPSDRIVISLSTKDQREADTKARNLANQLESYWQHIQLQDTLKRLIPANNLLASDGGSITDATPSLDEVKALYLKINAAGRARPFLLGVERAFKLLSGIAGNKPLGSITRKDANALRDKLLSEGLTPQSVVRTFTTLRAAFNVSISELDLNCSNVFKNVRIGPSVRVKARGSFDQETLSMIQSKSAEAEDTSSLLIGLISDTGMRLAEAAGLLKKDIVIEDEVPHINLVEHSWRPLKTKSSIRKIPLVGFSLRAARQILNRQCESQFAFPDLCSERGCKSNVASARLNTWLRRYVSDRSFVIHSFRHSLRDRLRSVECPTDMVDQLGGWASSGIGVRYGKGYPLKNTQEWMLRICVA